MLPKPYNFIGLGCFVVALARWIGSAALGSIAVNATSLVAYRNDWGWLIMTLLIVGAIIDVVIAGAMMFYLLGKREKLFTKYVTFSFYVLIVTFFLTGCR